MDRPDSAGAPSLETTVTESAVSVRTHGVEVCARSEGGALALTLRAVSGTASVGARRDTTDGSPRRSSTATAIGRWMIGISIKRRFANRPTENRRAQPIRLNIRY